MRSPGVWAGMCATLLVLAAPVMLMFGLVASIFAAEGLGEAPERLFRGGLIAGLGGIVTAALLLVDRLRPQSRRRCWELLALVVGVVTLLVGPVWGIGSYLWSVY